MTEKPESHEKTAPRVVAVVLTWRDVEMTRRCIASLMETTYPNQQVLLVDNGSEEDCAAPLKEAFPAIETLCLDANYGFTGGCNRGIAWALEQDAKYVFLLNNDTIIAPDALQLLVDALESRPDAGVAHPLLLEAEEEKIVQFYSGQVERDVARHMHPEHGQAWTPAFAKTIDTDFVPACTPLYRADTLRETGVFDETLYINWEDYDLHMRIVDAGWKLLTVGAAEVVHAHGQSTGTISPFITYFYTRNRLICLFRFGRLSQIIRRTPFFLRTLWWQMKDYGLKNGEAHRAFVQAHWDFLIGVRGRGNPPIRTKD